MGTINFKAFLVVFLTGISTLATAQDSTYQRKGKQGNRQGKEERQRQGGGKGRMQMVQPQNGNIILGTPTANSIVASVVLGDGGEANIEYGKSPNALSSKTATTKPTGGIAEINLGSLSPNTTYYYRLNYKSETESGYHTTETSWFSTQKSKSSTFSFALQGDSHPERPGKMFNAELYKQTISSASALKPDFYFMMGDDFSIDRLIQGNQLSTENVEAVYKTQRYYWGNAGTNPPLFLVNGNHEQANGFLMNNDANSAPVLAANARNKYFPLPSPDKFYSGDKTPIPNIGLLKDYYAFEWGNALFVVIDPYWHSKAMVDHVPGMDSEGKRNPWGTTLGDEQYQWFKKTLETSKAKYKFVFCHHVLGIGRGGVERAGLFEWGGNGQNGASQFAQNRPGWELPIHQLMVKNKVTIFFQGHDHLYAKQELDGIIYQSLPCPADDTYTAFNSDAYTSGKILPNSGFLNVTVSQQEVKVEYVRSFLPGATIPENEKQNFVYTVK